MCAGIAETYDIDVALVRILWVIAGIVWIGIPAYIVAWIALPGRGEPGVLDDHPRDIGLIIGLALVGIGAFIAVHQLVPRWWHGGELLGALLLIGGGIAILVMRRPTNAGDAGPDTPQTEVPAEEPATDTEPTIEAWVAPAESAAGWASEPPVPPTAWTQSGPWPAPEPRRRTARAERRAARPRPFLTPLTISILLIGAGITSLLQATGAVDVNLTVALAIATAFVGVALVVSTWFGRARALILVGILLTGATTVASALDVPLHGGVGNRNYHPVQIAQVQHQYELAVGQLVIDLRDLAVPAGTTTVQAQLGIGELEVDVPNSVDVVADAHAGAGSLLLFGHETGGWDVSDTRMTTGTGAGGTLQLDLKVGAGQVRVRRFAGDVELIGGSNP